MSALGRLLRRRPERRRGRPEDLWRELITAHAPGKTFVDVGCMWRVDGAYAFHALAAGATGVTGIDLEAATPAFHERNAAAGSQVRLLRGDLNDPALPAWAGSHQIVFCTGVLHHVPDPVFTLTQLRRLSEELLILGTVTIAERSEPQTAIFLPLLDDASRRRLTFEGRGLTRVGLDTAFTPERGYGNWFWLATPSCVRVMVRTAGFEVLECHVFLRVTTIVARPARPLLP